MNPVAKYLFALSAVIVAYCAYVTTAVPFLEGRSEVVRRQPVAVDYPDVASSIDKSHLPSIVPADAWELGSCKTLLTPQGTIYFEYWEPVDDQGTYQLMPFSIVINDPVNQIREAATDPAAEKPAPIVLRSLDGAKLRFSKPLTARSKKDDIELESALLEGQVTLFRPANEQNNEDELRIVSQNIQINRSQIFTLSDVHFAFGKHHGSGRNLSIQLAHQPDAESLTNDFSDVSGVEQMELAYVRELVLHPAEASPSGIVNSGQQTGQTKPTQGKVLSLSNQKSPLQISCDGPFVFQMSQQKAWFRENVVVTQLDQFRDRLECSSLQIELDKNKTETTVEKLVAVGTQETPAVITSKSQQTVIVGEELIFEVPESIVKAAGSKPVSIRSPTFAIESPTLEYHLAENGKLGTLAAEGPGILRGIEKERPTEPFEVKWDSLLTTRNLDGDRVRIDIEERAAVKFNKHNGIWADNLQFVLWQMPSPQNDNNKSRWQYLPSQLNARGNVFLNTEKVTGFTKELVANWPEPKPATAAPQRHTVSYRGLFQRPQRQDDFRSLPNTPTNPTMRFKGDKVVANVTGGLEEMQLRDLVVDGSLELENKGKDQQPFTVTGQSMRLVPQTKDRYRVTIDGQEGRWATLKTNGFDIEGSNLQLDQTANTIWVKGEGNLKIDPQQVAAKAADSKLPKVEGATVSWKGGMVFDGSKIYFEHFVQLLADRSPNADGLQSKISSKCEALTLELTESLRFDQPGSKATKLSDSPAEIKRMVFVDHVNQHSRAFQLASHQSRQQPIEFQNAMLDEFGQISQMQQLRVPMASVDTVSGDVVSSGPGEVMSYQFSANKSPLAGINKDNDIQSGERKLTCVHTRFDGSLTANADDGKMELERNTRSAWGDVVDFGQPLDPDRPQELPVGAAVLKADVLKVAQWTPRNAETRRELHADGNTSIQSELFEAVADRMTYTDVTDVLVIEGRPPADAKLSYRRNTNARPETLRAAKVMYRISDQWTDVFDVRSVDAGLPSRK